MAFRNGIQTGCVAQTVVCLFRKFYFYEAIIQCIELYRKSGPKADFPGASADFLLWGFNFAIFSKDGFG